VLNKVPGIFFQRVGLQLKAKERVAAKHSFIVPVRLKSNGSVK